MKKSFFAGLLIATSICPAARADTIFDAMSSTYTTNPALQAQRAYVRGIDENVAIAKSGYRPELYLAGNYTESNTERNTLEHDYDSRDKSVSANVNQSLFSGFQTVNSVRSADSNAKSEHNNLYTAEQQTLLLAASAYLDVLRDEAIVRLQKNNEELLKRRLDETSERFNVGELTRTDLAQSRARYSQATADRINAEGVLEVSKSVYQRVVGKKPGDLSEPEVLKQLIPGSFDEALEITLRNNYNIKAGKHGFNSAVYDVATNAGELLPSVDLTASASKSENDPEYWISPETDTDRLEVGVSMKIPLYNSGRSRAKIRQSKYNKWQAQEQLLNAERQAIENVTSAWETMISNNAEIKSIIDQVKANEIALDGVQKEESLGNRTVLDVLNAYQELLNSNVEEIKARRDYYVSVMDVLSSMGKLTAKELGLKVELYDPEKYYEDTRGKWLSTGIDKQ